MSNNPDTLKNFFKKDDVVPPVTLKADPISLNGPRAYNYGEAFFVRKWELEYIKSNPRATPMEIRLATEYAIETGELNLNGQ